MNLKYLTDKTLLSDTKALAQQYRHVTTKLLHHLKEIEKRRLFSDLGYQSLFEYVVRELGFSEPSATRRIKAARLLAEIPEIEPKIESGELTLSNLAMASQLFKNENIKDTQFKKDVIAQIENSSSREAEKKLHDIIQPKAPPKETVLKIALSDATYVQHEDLRALLAHRKLSQDQFYGLIFRTAYARLLTEQFKLNANKKTTSKNPRYITAQVKKAVFLRDKVCQGCGSKYALEFDHRIPFSQGGKTEEENLRILCRSCNQRARIRASL